MDDKQRDDMREIADSKYRPLKKSLKKTYKSMVKQVEIGQIPARALIDEFMAQARVMVSYPGFGDSHYKDFTLACDSLYKAFNSKELAIIKQEIKKISTLKKECHHRYK